METGTINQVKLPVEVCEILEKIETGGELTPKRAAEILSESSVTADSLTEFHGFDHPVEDCYGRKMIYAADNFELMLMSWNPGDFSAIHDHGYTQWGAVKLFGEAQHNIYTVKQNEISFGRKEILTNGSTVGVNHSLIHQMGNPTSNRFVSLHLYGCQENRVVVTADTKIYELENRVIKHTTGGAFFNLPENEVYDYERCPIPDNETLIYHCGLLLEYYNRQNNESAREKSRRVLNILQEHSW